MLNFVLRKVRGSIVRSAGRAELRSRPRAQAGFVCLFFILAFAPAFGQTFTLTASAPSPFAVEPGGISSSNLTVNAVSIASSVDVALSCSVAPVHTTGTPTCLVSPQSVSTPASPSLTITTVGTTPAALYTVTITGVDQNAPSNVVSVNVNLSVLAVTADYTLTVTVPVTPGSLHAGSGATAGITVTPLNGYTGAVTLSCSAVTPAVTFGPTCSFPAAVSVAGNAPQTSTLTISTSGTITTTPTTSIFPARPFYVSLLPFPGLVLLSLGCGRRKLLAMLAACVLALGLLLLPACNTSPSSTATSTGVTPLNTYTFTITGADTNALAPSNGTQSVSLTVN